jgi:hypothetical protein
MQRVVFILIILMLALVLFRPFSAHAMDAELMVDLIECESSGRYNVIGDDGSSVGIAQFQKATFNEMKAKAGMPNLRWKNPVHQMRLMIWMVDNGYGKRWTCYRKLTSMSPH